MGRKEVIRNSIKLYWGPHVLCGVSTFVISDEHRRAESGFSWRGELCEWFMSEKTKGGKDETITY